MSSSGLHIQQAEQTMVSRIEMLHARTEKMHAAAFAFLALHVTGTGSWGGITTPISISCGASLSIMPLIHASGAGSAANPLGNHAPQARWTNSIEPA
jgi:hypothetical protein